VQTLPAGVWLKQGYPELFVVEAETFSSYSYIEDIAIVFNEQQPIAKLNRELKTVNETSDTLYEVQFWDAAGPYTFEKLSSLPALPVFGETQGWKQDIALNFEAFWKILTRHFAFSKERGLDWEALYEAERAKALACQTPEALFDVCAALVAQLKDGHSGLSSGGQRFSPLHFRENSLIESWFQVRKDMSVKTPRYEPFEKEVHAYILETLLEGKAKKAVNDKLVWSVLESNIGYLGFHSCCDFAFGGASATEELAAFEQALVQAFQDFKDTAGLIIDARFNTGGLDVASLHLAGRFTTTPRLAFRKHEVVYNQHQPAHDVLVNPVAEYYSNPVVFLTSAYTCSAAEIATMAFRVLPTVTVMGQTTHGSLSDSMSFVLPNSWKGRLSNEIYIAADGKLYEGLGLPPHIETPDPSHGHFWKCLDETLDIAKRHLLKVKA
jgi:carboxyl-terminal processing protease